MGSNEEQRYKAVRIREDLWREMDKRAIENKTSTSGMIELLLIVMIVEGRGIDEETRAIWKEKARNYKPHERKGRSWINPQTGKRSMKAP